ncbi:MAG TPA: MarR family transcriptional regulator [Luteibacter sp.]|jgi:DNA-binding MarR family transcriptional regulator|uniref:MarR family winged helix-turn-helix transcriptional regulator n=1 Tax=Luteibacter sp. TaxID=1886636 RepID=UPI002F3F34D2
MTSSKKSAGLAKADFEQLSEFRHQIRRFERFSENAAKEAGLTPLQYLLLLHIKGYPGREWASVSELAERLQAQHHGVVALVTRCEDLGFVTRTPSNEDRRVVEVRLTRDGEAMLVKLAALHRAELQSLHGTLFIPNLPHQDS